MIKIAALFLQSLTVPYCAGLVGQFFSVPNDTHVEHGYLSLFSARVQILTECVSIAFRSAVWLMQPFENKPALGEKNQPERCCTSQLIRLSRINDIARTNTISSFGTQAHPSNTHTHSHTRTGGVEALPLDLNALCSIHVVSFSVCGKVLGVGWRGWLIVLGVLFKFQPFGFCTWLVTELYQSHHHGQP